MDIAVVSGDRRIPNADEFTETLTPFPEPTDLVYSHAPPPNLRPVSPPHKLRPIRCSARPLSSAAELDPVQFESGQFVEGWEMNGVENESRFFSDFSLSSDDGDEDDHSSAKFVEPANPKRQRKSRGDLGHFLENMVTEVMEKQEQMHTQLIEAIEKMEKERIKREEAWRRIETDRLKKDEALRTEETSRSLALVSFLQNLLGEEIQIPKPISQHITEENRVKIASAALTDMKFGLGNKTLIPKPISQQSMKHNWVKIGLKCDRGNKRWPEAEVQALITLRTTLDHKFQVASNKGSVWDEISAGMATMGYTRTGRKCKEKWENMIKYFKKLTENGKKKHSSDKTCPYFHELDLLYKNGVINSGIGFGFMSSGGEDDEDKNERDTESLETG